MGNPTAEEPDTNPRLNAAIARFLDEEASEVGCDRARLLDDFQEVRSDLQDFLGAHDRMNELAAGLRPTTSVLGRPDADATLLNPSTPAKAPSRAPPTLPGTDREESSLPVAEGRVRYFGDYELLEEIARGGMGVVYRARQVTLNRVVAVKMILSGQLASRQDIQRFRAEAEAAAHLDHPGIVPVHEVGEHNGQHYFSMGFVNGPSLTSELSDGPLAPQRAATLVRNVAEAVGYAHGKGVIHRDLKPGNILLDQSGQPRITDFGLAKRLRVETSLTATGQILGTPSYMPPEQAAGRADSVQVTADVYSLGAVLYACLTGRPPFQAANPVETMRQVLEQEPVPPRQFNPAIPKDLETICLKCLEKSRRRRYRSMRNLSADLDRFLDGKPVEARPISSSARVWRWCRRRPLVASLSVLLILSMVIGTTLSLRFASRADERADAALTAEGLATRRAVAETAAREEERNQRLKAEQLAARIAMNRGLDLCDRGETHEGLLWLAHALESVPQGADDLEQTIRSHLGAWGERTRPIAAIQELEGKFMTFSPDGRFILTKTEKDNGVLLRVRSVGEPMKTVKDVLLMGEFRSAYFSQNEGILAIAEESGKLTVHSLGDDPSSAGPLMHAAAVDFAAFAGDGQRLLTIDAESRLHNWDLASGAMIGGPQQLSGAVTTAAVDGDTGLLVVGYQSGGVELYARINGGEVDQQLQIPGPIHNIRFSADGTRVAFDAGDGVHILHVSDGSEIAVLNNQANCYWLDPETLATVGRRDRRARVWNLPSSDEAPPAVLRALVTNGSLAAAAQNYLVSTSKMQGWTTQIGHVQVWSTETGEPITPPLPHEAIEGISLNGSNLVTASDGVLRVWSLKDQQARMEPILRMTHPNVGWVNSTEFSPDGSKLLTGTVDGTARLWDSQSGELLHDVIFHRKRGGEIRRALFSPDGQMIVTASHDGTVRLWNTSDGSPIGDPLPHSSPNDLRMVWSVAFHPEGKLLATGTGSYGDPPEREVWIRLWNVETGEQVGRTESMYGGVRCLAFSPDGEMLASAGLDGNARLWNATTMEPIGPVMPHPADVRAIAFHPSGGVVVTGCEDGLARLWSVETGQPLGVSLKHAQAISCVTVSPDGESIATASHDKTARLWDAYSGQPLGGPLWHRAPALWVSFHPDGTQLTTASPDHLARIWQLRPPVRERVDQISLCTEVTTGMTLDADGTARNLTPAEWEERRARLRSP
ncbi:MAG: hypothetical protein DWQ45_23030 [Planctomycetota bacterium]|nr:MAG: hypothetical protein DWQ41_22155 [Planctomycetota bacterium]REK29444.1 MAG: hypothetical protein DWQ45_23030 [Planctomycetota bacterium]